MSKIWPHNIVDKDEYNVFLADYNNHTGNGPQDNVHGLGDRPFVSTAVKNYYIDEINGNDNNTGLSTVAAFKTWTKALTMIPLFLHHAYTIKIIGSMAQNIIIPFVFCKNSVTLTVQGSTATTADHVVSSIVVGYAGGGSSGVALLFKNLQVTSVFQIHGGLNIKILQCNPRHNMVGYGAVQVFGGIVAIETCDFGTDLVDTCIIADRLAHIYSYNNTGNGRRYGLYSSYGSFIIKDGTQPTGTTANETKTSGGQIF